MPEVTTLVVNASDVEVDDLLDDVVEAGYIVRGASRIAHGHAVVTKKVGPSNVTFDTTGGGIVVSVGANVRIRRQVPTADEVAAAEAARKADRMEFALHSAFRAAVGAYAAVEATTAKLVEYAEYRIDNQWSPLGAHLAALAERDIWANVLNDVGHEFASGAVVTFAAAVQGQAKYLRAALVDNRWRGSSSSAVSNVCEREMAEAASKWLRSYAVVALLHDEDQA